MQNEFVQRPCHLNPDGGSNINIIDNFFNLNFLFYQMFKNY
jgi:hypothetical protein